MLTLQTALSSEAIQHDKCSFISVWSHSTSKQASLIIQLNFNAHFAKWESSFTVVGAHSTNDPISKKQNLSMFLLFNTPYHHQKKDCLMIQAVLNLNLGTW